jgi:nucleotide-binding universal stress UspA family protein
MAALDVARELDLNEKATLTVVGVAPTAPSGSRCGGSALGFNAVVREAVTEELDMARQRLGHAAGRTDYVLLVEGEDPPLEEWIAARGFDLILLPARRRLLRTPGHPAAARLRNVPGAEVRVVPRPSG